MFYHYMLLSSKLITRYKLQKLKYGGEVFKVF